MTTCLFSRNSWQFPDNNALMTFWRTMAENQSQNSCCYKQQFQQNSTAFVSVLDIVYTSPHRFFPRVFVKRRTLLFKVDLTVLKSINSSVIRDLTNTVVQWYYDRSFMCPGYQDCGLYRLQKVWCYKSIVAFYLQVNRTYFPTRENMLDWH